MSPIISRRALAAGLGASLLTAGCGGTEPPQSGVSSGVPLATPLAAVPGFAEPTRWAGRTLRVGLWGGAIQQAVAASVLDPFAALTGCVVTVFAADYARLSASVAAGETYLDLIVADLTQVDALASAGVTQRLPADLVDPARLTPVAARDGGMPFYLYALVSAVRLDLAPLEARPDDWVAWGDLERYPSPRSLPASAIGTLEVALIADGVAREALYPLDVERALTWLDRYVASIGERWWRTGDEAVIWLIQDEVSLAAAWHYRVVAALMDGRPLEIGWRDAPTVADYLAVATGSPGADVALDLIRFALTAEVQSVLAYASQLGPVVPDAFANIAAVQGRRLPSLPSRAGELLPLDVGWWGANAETVRARFDEWLASRGVFA